MHHPPFHKQNHEGDDKDQADAVVETDTHLTAEAIQGSLTQHSQLGVSFHNDEICYSVIRLYTVRDTKIHDVT